LRVIARAFPSLLVACSCALFLASLPLQAQELTFHNAPASAKEQKNPHAGQKTPSEKALYHLRCARCHGEDGEGSGNIPALASGKAQSASDV